MENNITVPKSNFNFTNYPMSTLKTMVKLLELKHLSKDEYSSFDIFVSKILRNEILEAIKYELEVEKLSDSEPLKINFAEGLKYKVGEDIYPFKLLKQCGIGPKKRNVYFDNMDLLYEQFSEWETYQKMQQQARQQAAQQQSQQQSQPAGSPLFNNNQQAAAHLSFSNGTGQMNNNPVPTPEAVVESIKNFTVNTIMQAALQVPENIRDQYCKQIDSIFNNMEFDSNQSNINNIGQQQCSIPIEHVIAANYYSSNQQQPPIVTEEQQQTVPNQEEQQIITENFQEAVTMFPEINETFSLSNKEIEENAQNFKRIYSNYNSISKDARNGVKAPLAAFCRLLEAEKEKGVDTDSYNFKIMNPKKLSEDQIIFKDFNNHITGMVIKNPDGSYLPTITPDNVPV